MRKGPWAWPKNGRWFRLQWWQERTWSVNIDMNSSLYINLGHLTIKARTWLVVLLLILLAFWAGTYF